MDLNYYCDELLRSYRNNKDLNLSEKSIKTISKNTFNRLDNFNINTPEFKYLNKLQLQKNQIGEIKSDTFNGLENLRELDLSANKIELLEDNSFNGLKKLYELNLRFNLIKEINANTFNGLDNLKDL